MKQGPARRTLGDGGMFRHLKLGRTKVVYQDKDEEDAITKEPFLGGSRKRGQDVPDPLCASLSLSLFPSLARFARLALFPMMTRLGFIN